MTKLTNPIPLFLDRSGNLLDAGYVYVGVAGADPETLPLNLFSDGGYTIPIAQPLRTMAGRIVLGANPTSVYFLENDFSMRTRDADGNLVDYSPQLTQSTVQYQPLDTDLTAIAALTTSAYGRGLLTLANQAALKAATGIPDPLPKVGGIVSGAISRQSSGKYLHLGDGTLAGDTVTRGTVDPTGGSDGDIYLKYVP